MASSSTYRLLVVDDDPEFLHLLTHYLQSRGVDVVTALDGETAWQLFQRESVDVVLMDMLTPRVSSSELLARMHQRRAPPIFLMSGRILSSDEEAAVQKQHRNEIVFRRPLALRDLVARMDALAMLHTGKVRSGALAGAASTSRKSTPPPIHASSGPAPLELPPVETRTRAPAWPVVPALAGECSLLSLGAVALHVFEQKLTGVLDVKDPMGARAIVFHEGLIVDATSTRMGESLGAQLVRDGMLNEPTALQISHAMTSKNLRFGEAYIQHAGARASLVVEALERQLHTVIVRALSASMGTFSFRPLTENVVLRSQPPVDPVHMVQRACLELPSEDVAAELLVGVEHLPVVVGDAFLERTTVFERLQPGNVIPSLCEDRPSVNAAVQRARRSGPSSVRGLLALLLTQALRVGPLPASTVVRRRGVLSSSGGAWLDEKVPRGELFVREMIAEEWVRSGGRSAHAVLGVAPDASPATVENARAAHTARFGPPALDAAQLGPARRYLDLLRARRDEAARLLLKR